VARKHQLRVQRAGTVINMISKKQESDIIQALQQVVDHISAKFGKRLTLPRRKHVGFLVRRGRPTLCRSYALSPSVLRLRVPHGDGDSSYPFGPDVQGRVQVSVVHRPAPTGPNPVREGKVLVDCPALPTKLAAGEVAVNHTQVFAMPDRLVGKLPPKLAQRCVQNRCGQLGFRHPFQVQVFDAQPVVLLDESGGQLVQPVLSLVADFDVYPVQPMPGFVPVLAPFLLAGKLPLRPAKLALCFAVERGRGDSRTVRKHREVFQAEVNPYDPFRVGRGQGYVGHLELGGQGDVPMPLRIPLERGPLDGAIKGFNTCSAIQDITGTQTASPNPVRACTPFTVMGYSSGTP